jgi:hypothetical protein
MSLSVGYMKIGFTACTIEGVRNSITVAVQRITGEILSVVYQILQFMMECFYSSQ